jgi:hypothetical protein
MRFKGGNEPMGLRGLTLLVLVPWLVSCSDSGLVILMLLCREAGSTGRGD